MPNILLVTTSLEQTWQTADEIIFLGKWCNKYDNIAKLGEKKYKMLDYHWDDRQKLLNDYKYLNNLNKRLIKKLTIELNRYHKTNFT